MTDFTSTLMNMISNFLLFVHQRGYTPSPDLTWPVIDAVFQFLWSVGSCSSSTYIPQFHWSIPKRAVCRQYTWWWLTCWHANSTLCVLKLHSRHTAACWSLLCCLLFPREESRRCYKLSMEKLAPTFSADVFRSDTSRRNLFLTIGWPSCKDEQPNKANISGA